MEKVLISYVFYKKNKIQNLINFLDSMTNYPPASDALLIISLKDITKELTSQIHETISQYKLICKVEVISVPNIGFDLGTHVINTQRHKPFITIFMSASSKANHIDWYRLLVSPFLDQRIGIVGSMYSEESQLTIYREIAMTKVKHRLHLRLSTVEESVALMIDLPSTYRTIFFGPFHNLFTYIITLIPLKIYRSRHPFDIEKYPPFPNPHLRTTGLAIRSSLFCELITRLPVTKGEVLALESSYNSLTAQVCNLGYSILVCTYSGIYLNFGSSKATSTFRDPNSSSIVIDAESEIFNTYNEEKKAAIHKLMTTKRVNFD
jgi:hypothetical protein